MAAHLLRQNEPACRNKQNQPIAAELWLLEAQANREDAERTQQGGQGKHATMENIGGRLSHAASVVLARPGVHKILC